MRGTCKPNLVIPGQFVPNILSEKHFHDEYTKLDLCDCRDMEYNGLRMLSSEPVAFKCSADIAFNFVKVGHTQRVF